MTKGIKTQLCAPWGTEKTCMPPYSPQSNGIVERVNRVLGASLRARIPEKTASAMNFQLPVNNKRTCYTSFCVKSRETANLLMSVKELRLLEGLVAPVGSYNISHTTEEYATTVKENLTTAWHWEDNGQKPEHWTRCRSQLYIKKVNMGESKKLLPNLHDN